MENGNVLKRDSAGIGSLPLTSKQKPLEQQTLEQSESQSQTVSPVVDQSSLESGVSVENPQKNTIRGWCSHR